METLKREDKTQNQSKNKNRRNKSHKPRETAMEEKTHRSETFFRE